MSFPEAYFSGDLLSCYVAGSFGYEKEHYELSMQIGKLVLFPAVRNADNETIITAPGPVAAIK